MADPQPSATTSGQQPKPNTTYVSGIWVSYKIDFRTRFRSSLYSIGRILHIMNPTTDTPSDPYLEFGNIKKEKGFKDIDAYCTSLKNLYMDRKTHKLNRERWLVTDILTYKDKKGNAKHEYLVATVKYGDATVYMRLERKLRSSKIKSKLFGASSSQPKPIPPPDDSESSPDTDSPAADLPPDIKDPRNTGSFSKLASDGVTFSKLPWLDKAELVDIIKFREGHYVPMLHLAILARCVNSVAVAYHDLTQNCYFFAHVTCEALKELNPEHDLPPTYGKVKPASWRGLPVGFMFNDSKGMVKKVVGSFKGEMDTFKSDIHQAVNNPESEIYVAAMERETEERRKREEAEEEIKRLRALLEAKNT
jgi:hypothetical protein